jgi:hypothetical protein
VTTALRSAPVTGAAPAGIELFLRGLGYNDLLFLLVWMCQADPDLAARAAGELMEYHAACAEHREQRRKEKHREQRRRQRRRAAIEAS